jgi:hypothetical protein
MELKEHPNDFGLTIRYYDITRYLQTGKSPELDPALCASGFRLAPSRVPGFPTRRL